MNPKKPIVLIAVKIVLLAAIAAGVAGCNTVKGVGQDIEKGGEAIQKAVK
ncbi:MAG: entericidin [Betaproteobacteria bacterium CG2_30_59_46]|nr:MAG: entericidin [Betaproteobacteria bacterium CG2_30_59_46]PIQ13080.1 MAG: entericidin [Hydrogenophilales bacterium CG18_big_fil_WC_8_21_14_2_50_58_12]PIY01297.1 MAG: entericidin [Hydrogenophilales bacterium CG_4_10_14_3_um_filter_58_23]PJB08010.1 MAG: entericidin [Hydrogenophilales bacterium CG_4_9_14_3_um_filter_59_35]